MKISDTITEKFYNEFNPIKDKFRIIPLTISEAFNSKNLNVAYPGVYIFWYENKIIKVGRHFINSRKRALEHIRDNTMNEFFQMKTFENCSKDCGLVLINCKDKNDYYWVAALEIYLEIVLKPIIKSKRT